MKFTLEIELGNDAMQNLGDIASELRKLSTKLREKHELTGRVRVDGGKIMDENGNSVGSWDIA